MSCQPEAAPRLYLALKRLTDLVRNLDDSEPVFAQLQSQELELAIKQADEALAAAEGRNTQT